MKRTSTTRTNDQLGSSPATTATKIEVTVEEAPAPARTKRRKTNSETFYHVKWIEFRDVAKAPIVLQNENGPCPLIAISNVLLLKGKLQLPEGTELVSLETLLEIVGELNNKNIYLSSFYYNRRIRKCF